jgi:RHS repeat-associated protein
MSTSPDERSYKFNYDKLYRLTSANYQEKSGSSWGGIGAFDEKDITYDHNGNILTLKRNAKIGGAISEIDNLNYSYIANQLSNITDGQAETNLNYGFRNLSASTAGYEYDSDGSLVHDTKKGLRVSYNVLNKTNAITMTGSAGSYITYTYDAAGSLLRKQVYDNNALVKTTDYIEGYIFENGGLSQFGMAEGRVRNTSGALKYEYMIADNLGNVRVSFEDVNGIATVRQENSYYPFGLIMPGGYTSSQPNKNLYNGGSEWQDDFSNLPDYSTTFYRNYDAALGRFIAVDPKAESAESFTTYQFAGNNPLIYNDPMGDVMRLGDSNYTIPSHRIGPGSGNHWSDGIGYPDRSLDGGSDTYRALLGTAGVMQNSTGGFYTMDGGVKRDVKIGTNGYYTYQGQILNGGMSAQDVSDFMQMTGGIYAYLINIDFTPGIK